MSQLCNLQRKSIKEIEESDIAQGNIFIGMIIRAN